ncbi:DHA2 family efflux MFS transporter permease subunit [Varunaivibrio sulfuroxidans]|uniref:DHA2 family multidrug resistance protein n=1 Tax=Varunaivibrio sulfuroxidans TaxID=1773489 RepID=A0A4R3JB83_9PROT|nr:DHA2 family efflux MFS transporter permease subunit [Varunaivibrio sulfuroxidans]TCS62545.1 DHA2 family multidrug resistance protein [Varunaivibrio sulfuroxidans]WES30785.1 DHA2 family efflux MFS transporter permease subunit [Varunaivibrio sulfuroxidans]
MSVATRLAPNGEPSRPLITISIMLATVMQVIDTTIANVALPHMQGSLSATQDQIAWVLTSYIVAAAIMTPPTGFLAARFGRKRIFLAAVAGFTVASMLCGMATSLTEIVFFRLLQGVFGASLVPLSQAVLLDTYPRERHGSAMAIWGMGIMVGPILGPTLGGYLTEFYNWRSVFFINLPFGILAFLGILTFVPETGQNRTRPFDWYGFALLSTAIGALQLMLDRGVSQDWFSSGEIIIETFLAAICFYMFVVHILTADRPFLEPGLFRDRNLVSGLFFIFVIGIVLLATIALLPPFLQTLMGYPVLTIGLVLAPRGIGTMVAMMIVGRIIARVDPRYLIGLGLTLTSFSLWEMAAFNMDIGAWDVVRTGLVQGFGLGFVFVPLSTLTFATLQPHYRNEGTALFSLVRNLGSSIGISIVVSQLARNTQINHAVIGESVTAFNPALKWANTAHFWNLDTLRGLLALNGEVTRQALTIAYLNDFKLMMFVTLMVFPVLFLLRNPKHKPE